MMQGSTTEKALLAMGPDGGPARRAIVTLERQGSVIGAAFKRAVPFLTRQGVPVTPGEARAVSASDLFSGVSRPYWVAWLATDPGGARAAVILDAGATAFILDGVLGGNSPPQFRDEHLSPPQRALLGRVMDSVLESISSAFSSGLRFSLRPLPATSGEPRGDTAYVAVDLLLGGGKGKVIVAVTRDALLATTSHSAKAQGPSVDRRVLATLEEAELELIAELGRVRLTLGELTGLQVGDTLRLDVPLGGVVTIRVDDQLLMAGLPTTSGTQIAIRLMASSPSTLPAAVAE